jgi:FKBP-type peptidyl-prolyl cis-trans isomerase FklB
MKFTAVTAIGIALLSMQAHADVDLSPAVAQNLSQDSGRQAGETFLQSNKSKPNVVTLADGLQYKIITPGAGPKPTDQDVVKVNYEGKLINGTVFDSSAQHGGPIEFPLNQVIPGWVEALKLMQAGATWELYIPSDLAYGESGAPPSIGPNQALVFKVTLVSFKKSA